jgi:hypothetical protein
VAKMQAKAILLSEKIAPCCISATRISGPLRCFHY